MITLKNEIEPKHSVNEKGVYILLFAILIVATVLRLIHPFDIPFTYDEMSALIRTHFSSFNELIAKGVIIDAHPAGVQVFLYYWTKLLGYREIIVKLPFIVCGILSVYYIFLIGKEWFTSTTGLVCAAYIATLEYTIMYSQIARPYISGLFFSLAMVWYWSQIIFKPENKYYKNLCLYVIFSACCAYSHHFSLLFAILVGLTGLFFVPKKHLLKYVLAGICIFILYIPHLHIFFYQFKIGGESGWLDKPRNNFILEYLKYVFQFSKLSYLCVAVLFLWGLLTLLTRKKEVSRYSIISLCWFLIPFLIGFFYSRFKAPVLQYSVLIFSFPFLLLFLFGWMPELKIKKLTTLLFIICFVNIYVLVQGREYYKVFYKSYDEQQVLLSDSIFKKDGPNSCTSLSSLGIDSFLTFYQKKYHTDIHFYSLPDSTGKHNFINYLEQNRKPYLIYDYTPGSDMVYFPVILNYYPTIVQQHLYAGGTLYLLSSDAGKINTSDYVFSSVNTFEKQENFWSETDKACLDDSIFYSGKYSYRFDSLHEWGPAFSCDLNTMTSTKNDIIIVSVMFYARQKPDDVLIVSSIQSGDSTIDWRATPVNSCLSASCLNKWQKAYHGIALPDIYLPHSGYQIKIFIWNRGKKKFNIDNFEIKTLKGNPILYSIYSKI